MRKFTTLIITIFFVLYLLAGVSSALASNMDNFFPQQRIPGYQNDTLNPILITDPSRTVHAFTSQWLSVDGSSSVRVIMYNKWILHQGWTKPIDILISPLKNDARILDAVLDTAGFVHLIFWGGDNTQANIYISNAPISKSDQAQAWSTPVLVAENAQDPQDGLIYIDNHNNLVVLFAGGSNGKGLYITSSTNQGVIWSKPQLLARPQSGENSIFNLNADTQVGGWVHVIWVEYNLLGQGRRVFYLNYSGTDNHWGVPKNLAAADSGLGTMTAAIAVNNNRIFVMYNMVPKITMRYSDDHGETWSNPSALFQKFIGANGTISMVNDDNNQMHMFFAQRIPGDPDIHGMWHSVYTNELWTPPDQVVSGPLVVDRTGNKGFDPFDAQAILTKENTILVIWHTDYASEQNGIWYSYVTLIDPE